MCMRVCVRAQMDPHDAQLHINFTQDVFPIHRLVKGLREVADAGMSVLVCETRVRLNELARCVCCCTCVRLLQRSAALHTAERPVCACVLLRFARGQLLWAAPARVSGTLRHTAACQTHPWLTRACSLCSSHLILTLSIGTPAGTRRG